MLLVVSSRRAIPYSGKHWGLVSLSCSLISLRLLVQVVAYRGPRMKVSFVTVICNRE